MAHVDTETGVHRVAKLPVEDHSLEIEIRTEKRGNRGNVRDGQGADGDGHFCAVRRVTGKGAQNNKCIQRIKLSEARTRSRELTQMKRQSFVGVYVGRRLLFAIEQRSPPACPMVASASEAARQLVVPNLPPSASLSHHLRISTPAAWSG